MEPEELTRAIAVWGAITGTIGTLIGFLNFLLRVKQHRKGQAKLICESEFAFEFSTQDAKPKYKLIARSIGAKPVTIDYVRYYLKPKGFWKNCFRRKIWKKKLWVYDFKPRNEIQITEGKKAEINISLPTGIEISDVLKVEFHDQTGKAWKVKWPRKSKIVTQTRYEKLHSFEEANENRVFKLNGYVASESFHLYATWNPTPKVKNTFKSKGFRYKDRKSFEEKILEITNIQMPKILACTEDEVL